MTFEESTGEEWKEGTPYEEEDEDNPWDALAEAVANMGVTSEEMARAFSAFHRTCFIVWAVSRLLTLGFTEARAREFIKGLVLVAEAEGRSYRDVIRAEIDRIEEVCRDG